MPVKILTERIASARVVAFGANSDDGVHLFRLEHFDELGKILWIGLEIGIEEGRQPPTGMFETGIETRRLAAVLLEVQNPDAVFGLRQLFETLARSIGRAVVHRQQLPREAHLVQGRSHALDQGFQIVDLVVDRHHHRDVQAAVCRVLHDHQGTPLHRDQGWYENSTR
jgi:hypothetical protein